MRMRAGDFAEGVLAQHRDDEGGAVVVLGPLHELREVKEERRLDVVLGGPGGFDAFERPGWNDDRQQERRHHRRRQTPEALQKRHRASP